jgi:hypothetical protein
MLIAFLKVCDSAHQGEGFFVVSPPKVVEKVGAFLRGRLCQTSIF